MIVAVKSYWLYAALHEDIAEGFIWLKHEGLPSRCIVKITHSNNGYSRSVFCEALQFEKNFLTQYEQQRRRKIEDETSSIVISHWYRARLGRPDAPLETQTEYSLKINVFDRWYNKWYGKLRTCTGHPQVVVRVAIWLALLSCTLGVLAVPGIVRDILQCARSMRQQTISASSSANISALSVAGVLAWRDTYGDLLGKPREAVIERFGPPQADDGTTLRWVAAPKTGNRNVAAEFESVNTSSIVKGVKVFARGSERLDVMEVLKKAQMFSFATGTYTDTLNHYFMAATNDGRNGLQFEVTEHGTPFEAIMFKGK